MSNFRIFNRVLLVITAIALGVVLRGLFFNHNSIWSDEALSVYYASGNVLEIPAKLALSVDDLHPPLYYLLLHFWMYMGKTEFILRLFSALFSVFTIGVIYFLGKQLANYKVGIVSAFIFSISALNIYYSGEIRNYTLFCFLSLLSVYFFFKILEKSTDRWSMFLYIASTSLCMYTHNCGILLPLIENIFIFVYFKRYKMPIRSWIIAQLLIWVLYAPWFIILLYQIQKLSAREFSILTVISNIIRQYGRVPGETFSTPDALSNYSSFFYPSQIKIWTGIVFGFLFMKGLFSFKKKPLSIFFLLLYLFTPIILYRFVIYPLSGKFFLRYFIAFEPGFYIISSASLVSLKEAKNRFIGTFLFFFIFANIIAINFTSLWNSRQRIIYENWRNLAHYLVEKTLPSDIILFDRGKTMPAFEYYFKTDISRIGFMDPKPSGERDVEYERYLAEAMEVIAKKYSRIWLIGSQPNKVINFSQGVVDKHFVLKEKRDFGIGIFLYKNREDAVHLYNSNRYDTGSGMANPCALESEISCGESIIQQIDCLETANYVFFIAAQSSDTLPFYSNMEIILDGESVALHRVKAKIPMLYKAEAFISKGPHLIKVEFAQDIYRFNKKRRLLLGEVMYLKE